MKTLSLAVLASSLLTVGIVQAADYKLDPTHTKAVFYIDHFGTSTNSGGFHNINGDMTFSPEKQIGSIDVKIPAETLNTGLPAFDNHIKNADILDVAKYPTIEFKSTKWHFQGDKPTSIDGILTMKGQSHPVTLKTTKFGCYFSPIFKADVCGGDFEAKIDRSEWGGDFLVKDGMAKDVTIKIQAEAIKK